MRTLHVIYVVKGDKPIYDRKGLKNNKNKSFTVINLEEFIIYRHNITKAYLDQGGKLDIRLDEAIIIFNDMNWNEVVTLYRRRLNCAVSGGNVTFRHLPNQLSTRLIPFLLMMYDSHERMVNSIEYDYKKFKNKILPGKDFSKKRIFYMAAT